MNKDIRWASTRVRWQEPREFPLSLPIGRQAPEEAFVSKVVVAHCPPPPCGGPWALGPGPSKPPFYIVNTIQMLVSFLSLGVLSCLRGWAPQPPYHTMGGGGGAPGAGTRTIPWGRGAWIIHVYVRSQVCKNLCVDVYANRLVIRQPVHVSCYFAFTITS